MWNGVYSSGKISVVGELPRFLGTCIAAHLLVTIPIVFLPQKTLEIGVNEIGSYLRTGSLSVKFLLPTQPERR